MGIFPSDFVLNRTIGSFYCARVTSGSNPNTHRRTAVQNGENNGETDCVVDFIGPRIRSCYKSDTSKRSDPRVLALSLGPLGSFDSDSAVFGRDLTRSDRIMSRECIPS
jgi:hypothetical protein